jgi:hypothetical protein
MPESDFQNNSGRSAGVMRMVKYTKTNVAPVKLFQAATIITVFEVSYRALIFGT